MSKNIHLYYLYVLKQPYAHNSFALHNPVSVFTFFWQKIRLNKLSSELTKLKPHPPLNSCVLYATTYINGYIFFHQIVVGIFLLYVKYVSLS